jgi:hypothetical protein
LAIGGESDDPPLDVGLFRLIFGLIIDLFRSRAALEAEVLVLEQQIIVLRRGRPNRMPFLAVDRVVLRWACHLFPKARDALAIVRPDTVVRWHRAGFRLFWRWKSRRRLGRPAVPTEIQQLIREMSIANPLWGAPLCRGSLCRLLMQHALFGLLTAIPALKRPYLALYLWVQRPPHEIGVPPAVRAGNRLNAGWPDRGG